MDLIKISTAKNGEIPFSTKTCYKFRTLKKYPKLLIKVANILYFDRDEWDRMCQKAVDEQIAEVKRLRA